MASLRLATISRLTGICATSMKKESLSALLRCELVVVTRLVAASTTTLASTTWWPAGDGGGLDWASARTS